MRVEVTVVRLRLLVLLAACFLLASSGARAQEVHIVTVRELAFDPPVALVAAGDTVRWEWVVGEHSVENADTGAAVCSQRTAPATCAIEVPTGAPFILRYNCKIHGPYMSGLVTTDPPPTVSIDAPGDGDLVTQLSAFVGTAGDDTAVARVSVSWESTPIPLIAGSTGAVCDGCGGPSATWRAHPILPPGRYVVRATAYDGAGLSTVSAPRTVTIV